MARTKFLTSVGLAVLALVLSAASSADRMLHASQAAPATKTIPPLDADNTPLTSKNIEGHRLWIVLFDKTMMQLADVQHASMDALAWVSKKTPNVDVVAVAVIGTEGLEVRQDFTSNDAKVRKALDAFADESSDAGMISNDARSVGLRRLCEVLQAWPEKKDIISFTTRVVEGDPFLYRQSVDACEKANTTIDTVDARGLHIGRGGRADGVTLLDRRR